MPVRPNLVRFIDDDRVLVTDVDGRMRLLRLRPEGLDYLDWLRATSRPDVSWSDRERYGIGMPERAARPDLDALADFPLPARRANPAPNDDTAECDRLASNPYDRDRRAAGVAFEAFDAGAARPACERALAVAPQDLQTRYHLARIEDRLGNVPAAIEGYAALATEGYAIAMRGLARLLENDAERRFTAHGTPAHWMERAAEAGDPWGLANKATDIALDMAVADGAERALAILSAEGIRNRAETAMNLAIWISARGGDDATTARALFFALLGKRLDETLEDAPDFQAADLRTDVTNLVRSISVRADAAMVVAAYRAARDWRAGPSPY